CAYPRTPRARFASFAFSTLSPRTLLSLSFFVFDATPTTEIYPLSLHDALPIYNWSLLAHLDVFTRTGYPVLVGASRKGFLTRLLDRKSTRLNSSHVKISYAVFCLKKKREDTRTGRRQERQDSDVHAHVSRQNLE